MKLYIDSADLSEIKEVNSLGILDGVTTNPTLLARAGKPFRETIESICAEVSGPVNAETLSLDAEGIIREGREIALWAPNVVIKIPMGIQGLKAVKVLSGQGIKTNVTLVFSLAQGIMASKAGASYVCPFVGRLDDAGARGMDLVEDLVLALTNYGYQSEVIAASIRSPLHFRDAALAGADIITVPMKIFYQLFNHPLTDQGIKQFLEDGKKIPKS